MSPGHPGALHDLHILRREETHRHLIGEIGLQCLIESHIDILRGDDADLRPRRKRGSAEKGILNIRVLAKLVVINFQMLAEIIIDLDDPQHDSNGDQHDSPRGDPSGGPSTSCAA